MEKLPNINISDVLQGKHDTETVVLSITLPPLAGDYSAGAVIEVEMSVSELLEALKKPKSIAPKE
jgi:hypothetical protein